MNHVLCITLRLPEYSCTCFRLQSLFTRRYSVACQLCLPAFPWITKTDLPSLQSQPCSYLSLGMTFHALLLLWLSPDDLHVRIQPVCPEDVLAYQNDGSRSRLSEVRAVQTYRQTDATKRITTSPGFACGKNTRSTITKLRWTLARQGDDINVFLCVDVRRRCYYQLRTKRSKIKVTAWTCSCLSVLSSRDVRLVISGSPQEQPYTGHAPGLSSPTFSLDISPIYFPRTFPRHSPRYPHLSPDISPDIFRTPQTFPRISLGHPPPFAGHFPGRSPRHPRTFPGALSPRHSPDILGHFPGHCLVDINPDILRTFPRTFRPGISPGYFPRHFFWTHHPDIPRHSLDISADILSQKFYPRRFLGPGLFCPDIPRTVFSDVSPWLPLLRHEKLPNPSPPNLILNWHY